eukprot:TRINITY_DN8136_c0_g1_i3.p1 TRINITY_DN8136_c0_g1~~TRINITY_DN8136_c0_g1_i3.p1  ORF type:complete len:752 (+),score=232.49 TRINITY_DN8136_c0_g1_i3:310-2565(+)
MLDQQTKLQAQQSWEFRKKMAPLRCGKLNMRQWEEYEEWKQPQMSANAWAVNRGNGTLCALADTHWLQAVCEATEELFFHRIGWELPYRTSMPHVNAARVCYISHGCPKSRCDSVGRPLGMPAPSEAVLKAAVTSLGVTAAHFKTIALKGCTNVSLNARSQLELADLVILATDDVFAMAQAMNEAGLAEQVKERHRLGASVVACGAATALLSLFQMCPFVFIVDEHSSAEKEELQKLAAQRPCTELRARSAVVINTDGVTEPLGAVQLQNPAQPPIGMPNAPHEAGMRIAYERWAQTWAAEVPTELLEEVPLQACLEADFVIPQEHSVSPGGAKRAQALKLQGNESFKAGEYQAALDTYKQAAAADPCSLGVQLNLAACFLKEACQDSTAALLAANNALHIARGKSAKAYFRRALAFEMMGDDLNAHHDFAAARKLAPEDKTLQQTCKGSYAASLENPNEMVGSFQEAKENYFYQWYKVLDPAYEEWEARKESSLTVDRTCGFLSARALWLWDKLLVKDCPLVQLSIHVNIGADGVGFLAEGLRNNTKLQQLSIRGCFIRAQGAQAIKNAIVSNTALTSLDLSQNALHDDGLWHIALGLRDNSTITSLNLGDNGLDACTEEVPVGLKALCETMLTHGALQHLDLSANKLGAVGGCAVFEALRYSMCLSSVILQRIGLEAHLVARMSCIALDQQTLKLLDLRDNSVCVGTCRFVQERLQTSLLTPKVILLGSSDSTDTVAQPAAPEDYTEAW